MTTPRFVVSPSAAVAASRETVPLETAPLETVLRVEVPPDLVFFEGHFEGNPMLPGVAQVLALVDAEARRTFPQLEGRGARRMSRLKFQATIRPGDTLELGLALENAASGEPQVRFRLERSHPVAERASSGVLAYSAR